jgi:hypothetical protein
MGKKNQLFSRFSSRGTHQNSFRTITLKKNEKFQKIRKIPFFVHFCQF